MPNSSGTEPIPRPFSRRVAVAIIYAVFVFLLVEIPLRTYTSIRYDTPLFRPSQILYAYYPNLETVATAAMPDPATHLDVLLLGGSVLRMDQEQIRRILEPRLAEVSSLPVRVHNVATTAHTSLDSLYKYRHLQDRPFDLVIFYHSINELRANNCPPEVFRADYSHNVWNEHVNLLLRHPEIDGTVIPYFLEKTIIVLARRLGYKEYIPRDNVRSEWTRYGDDIKTQWTLAENIRDAISLAARNDQRFVLMTFSYYVPTDYSLEAFRKKELDYVRHAIPIEVWGTPANVIEGLDTHNRTIRRIHQDHPELLFVDQDSKIPKIGENFHDICHFSRRGCEIFANNLLEVLEPVVRGGLE